MDHDPQQILRRVCHVEVALKIEFEGLQGLDRRNGTGAGHRDRQPVHAGGSGALRDVKLRVELNGAQTGELVIDHLEAVHAALQPPAGMEFGEGRVGIEPPLAHRLEGREFAAEGKRRQVAVAHVEPPIAAEVIRPGRVARLERGQLLRPRGQGHGIVLAQPGAGGGQIDRELHSGGKLGPLRLGDGGDHQPAERARRVHHDPQGPANGEHLDGEVGPGEGHGGGVVEPAGLARGQAAAGEGDLRPGRRPARHDRQEHLAREVDAVEGKVDRQP